MMEAGPFRTKNVDAMRYAAACAVQLLDHTSDSTAAVSSRCRDVEWLELTSRSKISRLGAKDHILFHNYMVDNERVVEVHGNEIEGLIAMVRDQKDIIARLEQRIEGQDQMIAKAVRLSEQVHLSVHRSFDRGPDRFDRLSAYEVRGPSSVLMKSRTTMSLACRVRPVAARPIRVILIAKGSRPRDHEHRVAMVAICLRGRNGSQQRVVRIALSRSRYRAISRVPRMLRDRVLRASSKGRVVRELDGDRRSCQGLLARATSRKGIR